jgi:hypothetical protein
MGSGFGFGSIAGAVVANVGGMKAITGTVSLTNGLNTITHNLGALYEVTGWIVYDNTGTGLATELPFNRTANTFDVNVAGAYANCTIYVTYKHV